VSSSRRNCGAEEVVEVVSERHRRKLTFRLEAEITVAWWKMVENLSLGDSIIALPTLTCKLGRRRLNSRSGCD
jgi:hypothetical protein